jgi:CheY-like chemotaxis protein
VSTNTEGVSAASILVVEDSEPIRTMVAAILEQAGYRVTQAVNAQEAASLVDRVEPNLVITDIFMPEGDGFEMLRAIRHRDPPVPVIVMSGSAKTTTVDFLDLADHLGAAFVLAKPFKRQQLLEAVERVLARAPG